AFRMHHRVWRYTGLWDLINLAAAAVVGTLLFATFVALAIDCPWIPRTVYAIDTIVVIVLLGGARALRRILYDWGNREPGRRVLIFGAGDAGELIVRDMMHNPDYGYSPVGFVDDDRMKVGRVRIGDVRNVALEDLLCRRPVGLDPARLRGVIEGQSVLITGAGGSIVSELCRQISALKPRIM